MNLFTVMYCMHCSCSYLFVIIYWSVIVVLYLSVIISVLCPLIQCVVDYEL